jgi:DNA-binding NarL/FixJ family response regulator
MRYPGMEVQESEKAKIASLTRRQREVIQLICEGMKKKQIAERLFISYTTVRHHLSSIYTKLDVSDRLELVIYAYRYGLDKPPSEQS